MRLAVALGAAILCTAGCFRYIPTEVAAIPDGERVRVHLTRAGQLDLPELTDPVGGPVQGTLVRRADDRIFLRVPVAVRREGFLQSNIGQDAAIPFSEIVQIERRQLSRSRSGLMVAGTAGFAAMVVLVIIDGSIGREPGPPTGGDDLRIPIW